jgi:hypothetical protein
MKTILTKIASVLAFIIGGMAIFAGAKVLLGNDPGYYVINWLPLYNYTIGILSVFIAGILIWTNSRLALPVAIGTLSINALVMLILLTAYRQVVAPDSIVAMIIRITAWVIILGLILVQSRQNKALAQPSRSDLTRQKPSTEMQ